MDERAALIGLKLVRGIGSGRIRQLEKHYTCATAAWHNRHDWRSVPGFTDELVTAALSVTERDIQRQLRAMDVIGARLVTDGDVDYPAGLKQVSNPPRLLFVRGRIPVDYGGAVAVVGTRKASRHGLATARTMARDLAALGLVVVSGLARGIDGAAHRGALEAGGRTVAVLGCGLDIAYPPEHGSLMEDIAVHGGIITEYPMGTSPSPHHFPARNRLIAGLAKGVLLIEGGARSGALHTANYALDYGREVMAVPGDVHRWQSEGPNELIRQGATLVRNGADVLLSLGWTSLPTDDAARGETAAATDAISLRSVSGTSHRLVAHLQTTGPLSIDELADDLHMAVDDVAASLTWMELLGRVRREPGGRFSAFR